MNPLETEIRQRLAALQPTVLHLTDDSMRHAGHAGHRGGAHFTLSVCSAQFSGKNQVMRHRMVYQALHGLIPERIHALSLTATAPEENEPIPQKTS